MDSQTPKADFSKLKGSAEVVGQLQLPRLQSLLAEINASPDPFQTLEQALAAHPELDTFLSRCLALCLAQPPGPRP